MSIRGKLILVFVLVVGFSGGNLFVHFWSKRQTDASLEELRRATEIQGELRQIQRDLNDLQKQNSIMGQFISATDDVALRPEEIERFDSQTESVALRMETIANLVGRANRESYEQLVAKCKELIKSWRRFYLYFGRDHTQALTELALNAEPLGLEVMQVYMPDLVEKERMRIEMARKDYFASSELTGRITTLMFAGSTLILMLVLLWFSRDLVRRLAGLRRGAEQIGSGDLDHRIADSSRDELGELAGSFNEMGGRLLTARGELDEQYQKVESERARAEHLLRNILPDSTAEELRSKGQVAPQYYSQATVLFADIKGFTLATEKISVDLLVEILNHYFTAFDKICEKYKVEKLKTIGDCYMAVAGVPNRRLSHGVDAILAAWEFIDVAKELSARDEYPDWQVRVGIHSGPVIAGVVGIHKFAFDIWGSTVNRAARLEQAGQAGRVNISEDTRTYVKDFFDLEARGPITTKEGQGVEMYFVERPHASLANARLSLQAGFAERYRVYFREDLADFPASMLLESEK